jgi:hypothetical protein
MALGAYPDAVATKRMDEHARCVGDFSRVCPPKLVKSA